MNRERSLFSKEGLKREREELLIYLLHQERSSLLLSFKSERGWEWI